MELLRIGKACSVTKGTSISVTPDPSGSTLTTRTRRCYYSGGLFIDQPNQPVYLNAKPVGAADLALCPLLVILVIYF